MNAKLAASAVVLAGGDSVMVTVGPVSWTSHDTVVTVFKLPSGSVTVTVRLCAPCASAGKMAAPGDCAHGCAAAPSSAHANAHAAHRATLPPIAPWKRKLAIGEFVSAAGCWRIVTVGGLKSTVQKRETVEPTFPAASVGWTWKECNPGVNPVMV